MCSNNVPVSHCKDTYYFDKTNNYFKKGERKGDQVSDLLCPKLTELLYYLVKYQREAAILNDAVSATNTNDLKSLDSICFDFKLYVPNSYNKYISCYYFI